MERKNDKYYASTLSGNSIRFVEIDEYGETHEQFYMFLKSKNKADDSWILASDSLNAYNHIFYSLVELAAFLEKVNKRSFEKFTERFL